MIHPDGSLIVHRITFDLKLIKSSTHVSMFTAMSLAMKIIWDKLLSCFMTVVIVDSSIIDHRLCFISRLGPGQNFNLASREGHVFEKSKLSNKPGTPFKPFEQHDIARHPHRGQCVRQLRSYLSHPRYQRARNHR